MIDFSLTEEQELFLDSVKEFVDRNISDEKMKQWEIDQFQPDEVSKAFYDAGFGLLGVPEEYGGTPIDYVTMSLMIAEICRKGANLSAIMGLLIIYDILAFGNEEQKKFFLDVYTEKGSPKVALAISEPGAGSDNMAMTTTARSVDGKIVINGQKTFSSNAKNCNHLLVIAKDEDSSRNNPNTSLWIVPVNAPGVKLVDVTEIGSNMQPFSDVYFDNVVVDESDLLGKRGAGFMELMKNFELERLICGASSWGAAQCAMDEAAAYCSQRMTFGQPIGNYQLIQKKLVDMQIKIDNIKNMVLETAWKFDQGRSIQTECALMKYYCCRAAHEVVDDAMEIFGGIGYTTDSKISGLWIGTRGACIAGGTEEIMIHIAGRQLVKKYAKK